MTQLSLFDLPDEPTPAPPVIANPGNRPYGKGRPCTPFAPGTGPAGETCGGCFLAERFKRGKKQWIKCGAMRHEHTGGPGTDIKAGWQACHAWCPSEKDRIRRESAIVVGNDGIGALYVAAVYRRKKERPQEGGFNHFRIRTIDDLSVWLDYMIEECGWRMLLHPCRIDETGILPIHPAFS